MKAEFYDDGDVVMVRIETDPSTAHRAVATSQHKVRYAAAWKAYEAAKAPAEEPKKRRRGKRD